MHNLHFTPVTQRQKNASPRGQTAVACCEGYLSVTPHRNFAVPDKVSLTFFTDQVPLYMFEEPEEDRGIRSVKKVMLTWAGARRIFCSAGRSSSCRQPNGRDIQAALSSTHSQMPSRF